MIRYLLPLVVALAGAPAQTPTPAPDSPRPKIVFDKTVYDFGTVTNGESIQGVFTFRNDGTGVLTIAKPVPQCGCTVANLKTNQLQPGDLGELAFTLTLPKTRQAVHKGITIQSNDPQNPVTNLSIKGEVQPLYELSPLALSLNLGRGESTNLQARVLRTDGQKLELTRLQSTQTWINGTIETPPSANGKDSVIRVQVQAPDRIGFFSERLDGYVGKGEQPAFSINISGRVHGDLVVQPESVYWPLTSLSPSRQQRQVTVHSFVPGKRLELTNLSSSLAGVTLETRPQKDATSIELVARLESVPPNSTNGVIRFHTNVPSQPEVQIPVLLNVSNSGK